MSCCKEASGMKIAGCLLSLLTSVALGQNRVLQLDRNHVLIPHNSTQNTSAGITVEYWAQSTGRGRPVNKRWHSGGQFNTLFDSNRWGVELFGVGTVDNLHLPPSQFNPALFGSWNHFAVAWSSESQRMRFYVNGVLVGDARTTSSGMRQGADPLCFGDAPCPMYCNPEFSGRLDNIRLWSLERSQSEIATNAMRVFSQQEALTATGLIGSWSFDDGSPTDATGRNSGTFMGGASTVPDNSLYDRADCNSDGILDAYQLSIGQYADIDGDGILDSSLRIIAQPTDQAANVGAMVAFRVDATNTAGCYASLAFQWQRRNPVVADPAAFDAWITLSDGPDFVNTRTASLGISNPTLALATGYRCKISGGCGCGFLYTDTVNFSIACPADFNADGGIDFGDVEAFFERWEAGC
jgi:hypothetical protein